MSIPHIPDPLARRIDRLARGAHGFHRFAHHPLCEAYGKEVLRLGKRFRLCKGCAFLGLGMAAGTGIGAMLRPTAAWGAAALVLAALAVLCSMRFHLPKTVGRLVPGMIMGIVLFSGWPIATATGASLAGLARLYRLRGADRSRCRNCPHRQENPCPGFAPIVRRERAFQRLAHRWLTKSG